MELKDTIEMMTSEDYKERFKAEYCQLAIRYYKLRNMCDKWDKGKLNFKPTCPRKIYISQLDYMFNYLYILEQRAKLENVELPDLESFEYKTLREYINANSKGSYHQFVFNIGNKEIDITSVSDFEYYYNPHFLDDYVVIADDKTSNNGDCTSYVCKHRLNIKKAKY